MAIRKKAKAKKSAKKKTAKRKKPTGASASLKVDLLKKHLRLPHGYAIVKRKK